MTTRARLLLVLGSLAAAACPGDGGDGSADTDDGTGTGTGTGTGDATDGDATMSATQGPGSADDAPTGTSGDDGPATDDTTGPSGCLDDTECSGDTPFCSGGECVRCTSVADPDAACASLGNGNGLCVAGICVQCTEDDPTACEGETPLCDQSLLQCVGCSYHAQCDTGACDLDSGACMPATPSVWVRPLAANCLAGSGSYALPFCELQQAIDYIDSNGQIGTVHFEEGDGVLAGAVIPGDVRIAILAADGHRPATTGIDIVESGAHVYMEGTAITYDSFQVLRVHNGASAWLDRVIVYNNFDYAVDVRAGGDLHMRNTVIGNNGRISNNRPAVYIEDSSLDAQFTTLVANFGEYETVASLGCVGATSATMRNSIVVANSGNSIDCPGLDVNHSWLDTGGLGGIGNEVESMEHVNLSIWFMDPGGTTEDEIATFGSDFRLTPAGEAVFGPVGVVQEGDLPFDIELLPRSTTLGSTTTAGAYLEAP